MSALTSVSGFPRIGQNRELKKIIEAYWKGAAGSRNRPDSEQ